MDEKKFPAVRPLVVHGMILARSCFGSTLASTTSLEGLPNDSGGPLLRKFVPFAHLRLPLEGGLLTWYPISSGKRL